MNAEAKCTCSHNRERVIKNGIIHQLTNALEKLIDSGIQLGERVLGAIIIFIIGQFLINWLNRLFARILEKRKVDPSIQSFLKGMVNILLPVSYTHLDVYKRQLLTIAAFFSSSSSTIPSSANLSKAILTIETALSTIFSGATVLPKQVHFAGIELY